MAGLGLGMAAEVLLGPVPFSSRVEVADVESAPARSPPLDRADQVHIPTHQLHCALVKRHDRANYAQVDCDAATQRVHSLMDRLRVAGTWDTLPLRRAQARSTGDTVRVALGQEGFFELVFWVTSPPPRWVGDEQLLTVAVGSSGALPSPLRRYFALRLLRLAVEDLRAGPPGMPGMPGATGMDDSTK